MGKSNECKVYEISDVSYFVYLTDTCQRQRWCLDLMLGISPSVSQITMFCNLLPQLLQREFWNILKCKPEVRSCTTSLWCPMLFAPPKIMDFAKSGALAKRVVELEEVWQFKITRTSCMITSCKDMWSFEWSPVCSLPLWLALQHETSCYITLLHSSNRFLGIMKPVCSIQIPSMALGPWSTPIVFWPWFVIGRPVTGDESLPCSFQCYIARAFQACTSSGKQNQPWIKVTKVLSLLVQRQSKFNPWFLNIVVLRKAGNALVHKVVVVVVVIVVVVVVAFVVSLLSSWWFIFGSRYPSHPRQSFFSGVGLASSCLLLNVFFPLKATPKTTVFTSLMAARNKSPKATPKNAIQRIKQSGTCNVLCTRTFLSLNPCKMNKAQRRIITKKSSALVVFSVFPMHVVKRLWISCSVCLSSYTTRLYTNNSNRCSLRLLFDDRRVIACSKTVEKQRFWDCVETYGLGSSPKNILCKYKHFGLQRAQNIINGTVLLKQLSKRASNRCSAA